MTATEPSEDAIGAFVSFTNASREKAVVFLQANNFDSNRAINAYFENPNDPLPDPQVGQQISAGPQPEPYPYQSQTPQNQNYGTAPSRPPSRIGSREQREGVTISDAVEVPVEQSYAGQNNTSNTKTNNDSNMSLAEREEHQLQQAMARSLYADFEPTDQETGVIGSDGTKFGPANRDHYDENSWALTIQDAPVREVCIDPDPEERKRVDDDPAFLRPSEEAEYMSSLITILHAIPLAREALLWRGRVISDYGHDPQWWNGQPISPVESEEDGLLQNKDSAEAISETQRLMAFLDCTDRAFGSADSLANMKAIQSWNPESRLGNFFKLWNEKPSSVVDEKLPENIFYSTGVKQSNPFDERTMEDFPILQVCIGNSLSGGTLYDVLDQHVWEDIPDRDLDDVWLSRVAHIFTMRLNNLSRANTLDVKVPAVWYPDRYMESCKAFASELRTSRLKVDRELEKLHALIDRFSNTVGAHGGDVSFESMVQNVIAGLQVALKDKSTIGSLGDGGVSDDPIAAPEDTQMLIEKLKATSENIGQKIKALEERKAQAVESLNQLSKKFTAPSSIPDANPKHRYTLRGVCTLPHVMYVLRRDKYDPNRMTDSSPNQAATEWRWWRISFSVDDAKSRYVETSHQPAVPSSQGPALAPTIERKRPRGNLPGHMDVAGYTTQPVREIEVLRAAKEEHHTVHLVYASDDAVNFQEESVPDPLQVFMNADNESFHEEIEKFSQEFQAQEAAQANENRARGGGEPGSLPDAPNDSEPHSGFVENDGVGGGQKNGLFEDLLDLDENPVSHQSMSNDQQHSAKEMQELSGQSLLSAPRSRLTTRTGSMEQINEEPGDDINHMHIDTEQRSAPAA